MSSGQLFYHYTGTSGAEQIRNEGLLRSLNGVMLSTLLPEDHTCDDVLHSIHGNIIPTQFRNRADNVVIVNGSRLDSSKLSRVKPNLFKYSGDIHVSANNVRDNPSCTNPGGSSSNSSTNGASNGNASGSSGSVTSQPPKTFYYYTNESTAARIKSSLRTAPNCNVLLTTMEPKSYFRNQILEALHGKYYDRNLYATCADWCVKIDALTLNMSKLKELRPEVYQYTEALVVDPTDVMDKPQCTSGGTSNTQKEYLYHYTDLRGSQAIQSAGYIKISRSSGQFGAGVYLTDMGPTDYFRDDILKNNYGRRSMDYAYRADFVVRVKKSDLVAEKLRKVGFDVTNDIRRKIFVYDEEIQVNNSDVYLKPKCYRAE